MSNELVSFEEQLQKELAAQQTALTKVAGGSQYISCKGGLLTVDKQPVPNNQMDVIVVAYMDDRAWYGGPYDPESLSAPDCYAIGTVVPHEKAKNKQHTSCDGCPKNAWGSAMRDGKPTRGKACRESVRVVVIPGGNTDPGFLVNAEMRMVKFPPTSIANFREFAQTCLSAGQATFNVVARLQVKPDAKTMFKIVLTPLTTIKDKAALGSILQRIPAARELLATPYIEDEAPVEEAPAGKKKF